MREAYGIEAPVLPAPHAMDPTAPQEPVAALDGWSDYHLVVSRLLPYKNVEAAVEAFRDLPSGWSSSVTARSSGPSSDGCRPTSA